MLLSSGMPRYGPYVELAVTVFKTRNILAITSLKNFLLVLPHAVCMVEVIKLALEQLAATEPDTCRWLFRYTCYLKPEIDLVQEAQDVACWWLQKQGLIITKDFWFETDGKLRLLSPVQPPSTAELSPYDLLLLQELLHFS